MSPSDPLPTCRRKALWVFAASLASFGLAWAGYASGLLSDHLSGFFAGMGGGGVFAAALQW